MKIRFKKSSLKDRSSKDLSKAQTRGLLARSGGDRSLSFSPKCGLETLLAPLQLLDQRLQQSIEVRQVLLGTAFETYLLGSRTSTCPLAAAISEFSSLARLQALFSLSDFEIEVVLMAIAPELDRRYERLYAQLQPNACRKPTLRLSLDVLCHSMLEKENAAHVFIKTAPLVRFGLIHLRTNGSFSLNPVISRYLLGQSGSPQVADYCKLSWHENAARVTNSPHLVSILNLIREGDLPSPLRLNFTGQGEKMSGVRAIAATSNQPLLTVNLSKLAGDKTLSNAEITHKVQQILLQGQLWNAVLLLENSDSSDSGSSDSDSSATFCSRWFPLRSRFERHNPAVMQTFLEQIPAYLGVVICSDQVLPPSSADSHEEFIDVAFTAPETSNSGITAAFDRYQQKNQKAAPSPLSETEWFRQKLTGTTLGLG